MAPRKVVQRVALAIMVAKRHGFGLCEKDRLVLQRFLCLLAKRAERDPALDGRRGQARPCDDVVQLLALADEPCQRVGGIQRRQVLPLQILDGRKPQRIILREPLADVGGDGIVAVDLPHVPQ